jgi:hypothetical protein
MLIMDNTLVYLFFCFASVLNKKIYAQQKTVVLLNALLSPNSNRKEKDYP